jgi:hypothetical protein
VNPKAGFGFRARATSLRLDVLKTSDIGTVSGSREAIDVSLRKEALAVRPTKKKVHLARQNSHGS